jgi:selenium metabolism protein YedF
MSDKIVEVDAIGNACPIPVVKTIKAIKGLEGAGVVVTKVDNETAVKNLAKLASDKGYTSESKQLEDGNYEVTTTVSGTEEAVDEAEAQQFAPAERNVVVVVAADHQGEGDDELGRNLMKMFIYTLSQMDELPKTILFYNGGVRLTCEGSPALEDLKLMADAGVEIISCGTCLNFYGLTDKLAVGSASNMYVIVQKQLEASLILRP